MGNTVEMGGGDVYALDCDMGATQVVAREIGQYSLY